MLWNSRKLKSRFPPILKEPLASRSESISSLLIPDVLPVYHGRGPQGHLRKGRLLLILLLRNVARTGNATPNTG